MTSLFAAAGAALVLVTGPAGAASPPPAGSSASGSAAGQTGRFSFMRYTAPVPREWVAQTPASSFRAAQYRVPAAAGAADGEVVVFYFGAGQGGSATANVERWSSQFTGPDGKPAQPKVQALRVDRLPATLVELNGTYARGVGMGGGAPAKPNQTLVAAIVEAPEGNLTFQIHGDQATVKRHRKAFDAMVNGLRAR